MTATVTVGTPSTPGVPKRTWPRRLSAAVGLAVGLSLIAGVAYGYFRSGGSGTGSAGTGSAVNVTVTAATAANDLFPGHAGTVKFTLKNTNPFTTNFTSVKTVSVSSGNETACPAANILVATLPYSISTISVASGQTTATKTISGLISMSSTAPSTCQGMSFTVALTLSGQTN